MNIVTFTHKRDIDGMGCAILSRLLNEKAKIIYCDYNDVLNQFIDFVEKSNINEYDKIFILDLSISEHSDLVSYINNSLVNSVNDNFELEKRVVLLDHHKSSLPLNEYSWATVEIMDEKLNELTCATTMFWNYILENNYLVKSEAISSFVEDVRKYDTWLWSTKYNEIKPKQLTDLFEAYGINKFVEHFYQQLKQGVYQFDEVDTILIEAKDKEIKDYIAEKERLVIKRELQGYQCFIVFADRYRNDLAEYLKEKYPKIDIVIIVGDSLSFRSNKDYVDLSSFASKYGGGGGKQTAGASIPIETRQEMINLLFQ